MMAGAARAGGAEGASGAPASSSWSRRLRCWPWRLKAVSLGLVGASCVTLAMLVLAPW